MPDEYRSLKVPLWVYENAVAAQGQVVRRGVDSLPEEVTHPKQCPRCQHEVRFIEATAELKFARIECPHCNYQQQTMSMSGHVVAGIGLGVILGLGLACLLEKMSELPTKPKKRKGQARTRTPKRKAR